MISRIGSPPEYGERNDSHKDRTVQPWVEDELRTVDLPDERLNKSYQLLLDRLSDKPTLSIPAACNGWSETQAAYRFFDNQRVEPTQLLKPHFDATIERIRGCPVVLIPQDTTEFDLTRGREKIGVAVHALEGRFSIIPMRPGMDAD